MSDTERLRGVEPWCVESEGGMTRRRGLVCVRRVAVAELARDFGSLSARGDVQTIMYVE